MINLAIRNKSLQFGVHASLVFLVFDLVLTQNQVY